MIHIDIWLCSREIPRCSILYNLGARDNLDWYFYECSVNNMIKFVDKSFKWSRCKWFNLKKIQIGREKHVYKIFLNWQVNTLSIIIIITNKSW